MKLTRIAIAIAALALLPSSGMVSGGAGGGGGWELRPRSAVAGPLGGGGLVRLASEAGTPKIPAPTLNGKAKRDLGMAVFLSADGLAALAARQPQ